MSTPRLGARALALLAALAPALGAFAPGAMADGPPPPNVVLIVADDLGYGDLGAYGATDIATPNIDSLARDGVRFTDGYATAPVCAPSRAGLLAGFYQQRFGLVSNDGHKLPLPETQALLPETFRAGGYATGLVGKWNVARDPATVFDEVQSLIDWAADYWPNAQGRYIGVDDEADSGAVQGIWGPTRPGDEYLTDRLGRQAADFIDRRAGQPFFLYVGFNAAHTPLHGKSEHWDSVAYLSEEMHRLYASMRLSLDENVGRILAKLDEKGLAERTIVAFVSDNGALGYGTKVEGWPADWPTDLPVGSAGALKSFKGSLWEGGIRIPYLLRWPGRIAAGQVYREPVSTLDLYPTLCAAAGVAAPAETVLDGADLLPHLAGESLAPPHEALYWRNTSVGAIRMGRWKLYLGNENAVGFLHDLETDPGERTSLTAAQPEIAADLRARWKAWNAAIPGDADKDGVPDAIDNCPSHSNTNQWNTDGDAEGNACDGDDDNDGVEDGQDNCQTVVNPDQRDNEPDGLGDRCDGDDDNDGTPDIQDGLPLNASERGPIVALPLGTVDPAQRGAYWGDRAYYSVLVATFQGPRRDRLMHLKGYDIDNNRELGVWLNGRRLGYLSPGPNDGDTLANLWLLPASMQVDGTNRIELRQTIPSYKWGVSELGIYELDTLWGNGEGLDGGDRTHPEGIDLHLQGQSAGLLLELAGWDGDLDDEIALELNGQPLTDLPASGDGTWGEALHLLLAGSRLRNGDNALSVRNRYGPLEPWALRLVRAVPGNSPLGAQLPGQGTAERRPDGVRLLLPPALGLTGLDLAYYDADSPVEIALTQDGLHSGYAPVAPGDWGAPQALGLSGMRSVLRVQSTSYLPRRCSGGVYGETPSCLWGVRISGWH
jgi:arylsulfatase A-like enzyme